MYSVQSKSRLNVLPLVLLRVAFALALVFTGVVGTHAEAATRLPDLIVSAVSAPSTAQSGQSFVLSASIKNQGRASASAVQAAFYLTKSTSSITGATVLGTQNVGSLSAGARIALTTTLSIPSSTSSGTFYVVAVADPSNAIKESNETNNTRASGAVAVKDSTPPTISSVTSSGITASSATITWNTDKSSSSQADYGTTAAYGSSTSPNSSLVTSHAVTLSGLTAGKAYHFRVQSKDAAGNTALSSDYTFTTANPSPSPLTAWVTDALTRVQPTDPPGPVTTASLQAARNEYEGVQIIIKAPSSQPLSSVMVTASDLTGPGTIPSGNIVLYRETYIQVTTSSPDSPYPAGWWPDPLIPLTHPDTGANLGQPFSVTAGQNVPIYVEVYVPTGTPPGSYTGSIQVSASGAFTSVPLALTVWNFTLPTRPALRSNFANFKSQAFADKMGVTYLSSAHYTLMEKFEDELLRHRLSPSRLTGTAPTVLSDGSIDTSGIQAKMARYMNERGLTSWDLPFSVGWPWTDPFGADRQKAQRYLTSVLDWLETNGWLQFAYHDGIDEPESAAAYQAVRDEASNWHGLDPRAKMLITEQTKPAIPLEGGDPSWGNLYGSVDIWTPEFDRFDAATWADRRALGEQSWMYGGWGSQGAPGDLLDRPVYEIRVPVWIGFQYGVTGLLKWNTVYWDKVSDTWTNPSTYSLSGNTFNGDGVFFYPGTNVGYNGPIASLRLKAFRDAIDDYDYLTLLAARDPGSAQAIAQWVGTTFTNWVKDPTAIASARAELGRRLGGL